MPVVTINAFGFNDADRMQATLNRVTTELAAAIGSVPGNVWAHFSPMAALQEGTAPPVGSDYHPIVTVLADPRPEDSIARGLEAVAKAVAEGLDVKLENVWVHWVDLPRGRVFGGGRVK